VNQPIAFIFACVACLGLVILGRCTYLTIVYGHGDPGAGNWGRCNYQTVRDPTTGKVRRNWEEKYYPEGTEEPLRLAPVVDMWFLGFSLVVLGAGIYVVEKRSRGKAHF